jgi:hypothetical protein
MYLSLILMYFGLALGWGVVWMFIPAAVFSVLVVMTALKEEEYLLRKFGSSYKKYMQHVRWRFIPECSRKHGSHPDQVERHQLLPGQSGQAIRAGRYRL